MTALKQANEAISIRRKRKRKAFRSRYALSVREVQAIVDEDYIEAEIREDVLKPKKSRLVHNQVLFGYLIDLPCKASSNRIFNIPYNLRHRYLLNWLFARPYK